MILFTNYDFSSSFFFRVKSATNRPASVSTETIKKMAVKMVAPSSSCIRVTDHQVKSGNFHTTMLPNMPRDTPIYGSRRVICLF